MKLRYLFTLPLLGAALMGCDKIEYSDAKPITNPELPGISATDFTVTRSAALSNTLNLDALQAEVSDPENYMIELYTINVLTENLPADAVLSGGLELSATPDFAEVFNITDVTVADGTAFAPLSSFIYTRSMMFGKDPRPYTVYYRVPVYVTVDGGQYRIGSKDTYFLDGYSFEEEGVNPGYVVEEAYYLLGPNGMSIADAVEFEHSEYNIYDDAIFTVSTKFAAGNSQWLIVPQSVYQAALNGGNLNTALCYGPATAEAVTGELELGGAAGKITADAKYSFSINLAELTYEYQEIADFEYLYTPGNSNGWSQEDSQALYTSDYEYYHGYAYLNGEFKFCSQLDWDGINYGAGATEGTLSTSGGNLEAEEGLYWAEADIVTLTYSLTPITSISLIGSFNDWGGDVELTPSADYLTWTGTITFAADAEWKFRMNNDWAHNLGGNSFEDLTADGPNLSSTAGTYTITLDLSKLPYSCTVVAQ